ncbi:MAG TPA: MoaD/ThiS family protein [Candidatus Rubrimentiphilum sp.]|nr:MoaD/ThiS family protein [Candidatus Rubrimentiphilum sp.]
MKVRVLGFARLRELLGASRDVDLPPDATAATLWKALAEGCDGLPELAGSTRIARNGRIVNPSEPLADGDEIALLPPVGGG